VSASNTHKDAMHSAAITVRMLSKQHKEKSMAMAMATFKQKNVGD